MADISYDAKTKNKSLASFFKKSKKDDEDAEVM